MRLFRSILLNAILPLAALILAALFAPAGPPPASAAAEPAATEVSKSAPPMHCATNWLHRLMSSTRALLS